MLRSRRFLLAVALAVPFAAGCDTGVVDKVRKPIAAEVTRTRSIRDLWSARCTLTVHAQPEFEENIPCDGDIDLAENELGTFIAFRDGNKIWQGYRLTGENHLFDCTAPLGTGRKPKFDQLDTFEKAWPRMLECQRNVGVMEGAQGEQWLLAMANAIRQETGSPAVGRMFSTLATSLPHPLENNDGNSEDEWLTAIRQLPVPEQAVVTQSVCPYLADPKAESRIYLRAVLFCRHDTLSEGEGAAALAHLQAGLAGPVLTRFSTEKDALNYRALISAGRLALRSKPEAAGKLGCDFLAQPVVANDEFDRTFDEDVRRSLALAAVSISHTVCPTLGKEWDFPPCNEDTPCGEKVCDQKELDQALSDWLGKDDYSLPDHDQLRLTAALAQGTVAKAFLAKSKRHAYSHSPPVHVDCDAPGAPGKLCDCDLDGQNGRFCALPDDGGYAPMRGFRCEIRVDDRKKLVGFARRFCKSEPDAGRCLIDSECCGGLRCQPDPRGDYSCQPPPPPPPPPPDGSQL